MQGTTAFTHCLWCRSEDRPHAWHPCTSNHQESPEKGSRVVWPRNRCKPLVTIFVLHFPLSRMCLGAWPVHWAPYGRRGGVVGPLGTVWPPWVGPVPWVPYGHRGGVARPLGPVLLPWGRGRSPGPRIAAVGSWPVPWALCGRRGGVAGNTGRNELCVGTLGAQNSKKSKERRYQVTSPHVSS